MQPYMITTVAPPTVQHSRGGGSAACAALLFCQGVVEFDFFLFRLEAAGIHAWKIAMFPFVSQPAICKRKSPSIIKHLS